MAKLVFGMNQSLDGYVDHMALPAPSPALFRHFIEQVRGLTGSVYGRRMYEVMRYWDEDLPECCRGVVSRPVRAREEGPDMRLAVRADIAKLLEEPVQEVEVPGSKRLEKPWSRNSRARTGPETPREVGNR